MIKLLDSQIAQILPECLSGRASVQALSFALHRAVERLIGHCGNTSVFAVIDAAPDYVLDRLAIELNTQYYDDSLETRTKRKLIKNTLVWYMSAGTPQAVEELVAAVFGEGEVTEWFEYGDEPYFFKITTNAQMTPEMDAQFTAMLERVKNARSHIRAIEIHRTTEQALYSGACAFLHYKPPAVIDGYGMKLEIADTVYAGIANVAQTHPAAILDVFFAEGEEIQGCAYSGASVAVTAKNPPIRESFASTADTVGEAHYSGVAQDARQKPSAILGGFSEIAKTVTQANAAGTVAASRYKNIIQDRR